MKGSESAFFRAGRKMLKTHISHCFAHTQLVSQSLGAGSLYFSSMSFMNRLITSMFSWFSFSRGALACLKLAFVRPVNQEGLEEHMEGISSSLKLIHTDTLVGSVSQKALIAERGLGGNQQERLVFEVVALHLVGLLISCPNHLL